MRLRSGQRVVWRNHDATEHTITAGTPEQPTGAFDLRLVGAGARGAWVASTPGVVPYFCRRHPQMRGLLVVEPDR